MTDIKFFSLTFNGGRTQRRAVASPSSGTPAVRWMEVSSRHIGLRMNRVETCVLIRQLHKIIFCEVLK